MKCWGRNDSGQLGNGGKQDLWTPNGPDIVQGAISVVAGLDHTCALLLDGTVKCWGENTYGAVGDGSWLERLTPVELPAFCP